MTLEQFQEVRRRLAAGERHVEISRELDLSVWTIVRIATEPEWQRDDLIEEELPADDRPADFVSRELRRCEGCGAMVYRWPCLACEMAELPRVNGAAEEEEDEEEVDELFEMLQEAAGL